MLGANLQNLLSARKDIAITPSTKLKQLQWDKLPQQQAEKTVFKEPSREDEWVKKLQLDGVWMEMEEDEVSWDRPSQPAATAARPTLSLCLLPPSCLCAIAPFEIGDMI